MAKYLLTFLSLLVSTAVFSEQTKNLFVNRCLEASKQEPSKVAINICQKAKLEASSNVKSSLAIIRLLISLHQEQNNHHQILVLFAELESIANSDLALYEVQREQGKHYYHRGDFTKAEHYFSNGLELAKKIAEPELIAKSLNETGLMQFRNLKYELALVSFQESLEIKKALDLEESIAVTIRNIGLVYYRLNDNEKALKFYLEALSGYQKALLSAPNDKAINSRIIHINAELAAVYSRLGNTDLSQKTLNKVSLAIEQLSDSKIQLSRIIDLSEGLIEAKDYEIARKFLYKANNLLRDNKDGNFSRLYYLLSKVEYELKNNTSASIYINKSISMAEMFNDNLILLKAYNLNANILIEKQEYQEAYSNLQEHMLITQKENKNKFNESLSEVKLRLETELHEKLLLEKSNKLLVSDSKNKQLTFALTTSAILIFFIGFFIFYLFKVNKHKRKQLNTQLKIHKEKLQELERPLVNFKNLFSDIKEEVLICNDAGFLLFTNIKRIQHTLVTKNLNIQEVSTELNSGLELVIGGSEFIDVAAMISKDNETQSTYRISPLLNGDYYIFAQLDKGSLSLPISEKINIINRFSQSINSLIIDKNDIGLLRPIIVDTMTLCVDTWVNLTNSNKIEFADQSKIWKVNIDEGRLRTRSLDKYLSLNTLPKQPRLKNVIKTCHFLLSNKEVASSERIFIENQLNKILAFDKS